MAWYSRSVERLRGRDRDRVAGVHAHGIEVLDRADDDDVVLEVAHHLELVFLPAEDGFLDQGFVDGREIEAARQQFHEFFAIEGNAATCAAQRERWPNDDREADFSGEFEAVFEIVNERGLGNVEADLLHRVFEEEAIFSLLDRRDVCADEKRVVFVEHAAVGEFDRKVERGLSADGGQNSETCAWRHLALDTDDFFQVLAGERLDVSAVGDLGVGHDGRRIRVRQHHFVALSLERLAGLRAGVIELGRLPDDDGAGAEDQDFRDVVASRH